MAEEAGKVLVGISSDQATLAGSGSNSNSAKKIEVEKQIAYWLAVNFSSLRKRQKRLKTLKDFGPMKYTEDMAIADLTSISVNTGSDKVQTSGISKVPERVALLLSSGYVEKMQEKMNHEYEDLCDELEYVTWQLDIIDAAMEERMTERQRVVFRWVYLEKMSLRYIHDNLMPEISRFTLSSVLEKAVAMMSVEVAYRRQNTTKKKYLYQLTAEVAKEGDSNETDGKSRNRITGRRTRSA
jgi:hypothetical protein